ncbi:OsmC family peroxiredoxin, partial [Aeromicrobium phragmitis]
EELIAMAHSACLAMQLSALISEHGATSVQLDVTAEVALGPDPAGGFRLMGIDLAVTGSAAGLDAGAFAELTETAKRICPVSKALTGVEISLATTFVPA